MADTYGLEFETAMWSFSIQEASDGDCFGAPYQTTEESGLLALDHAIFLGQLLPARAAFISKDLDTVINAIAGLSHAPG